MNTATQHNIARIANLNDQLRKTGNCGQMMMTAGLQSLGEDFVREAIASVRTFDRFTKDNDPHGEHDFGSVEVCGNKVFWKIDYYDKEMEYGSEDPSDPDQTSRVLTVMLAQEY